MEHVDQRLLDDQRETVEDQRSQFPVDVLPVLVQERVGAVAQQLVAVVQILEIVAQPGDVEGQLQVVGRQVFLALADLRFAGEADQQIRIVCTRKR